MNYMQNADTIYIISLNDKICSTNNDKVRALTDVVKTEQTVTAKTAMLLQF